jgi:hypothetical protein
VVVLDMLYQKKETIVSPSDHEVIVDWHMQGNHWWNETCAMVLEVFGLPGQRFVYSPSEDFMTFTFKSKRDADLCRILLSERL